MLTVSVLTLVLGAVACVLLGFVIGLWLPRSTPQAPPQPRDVIVARVERVWCRFAFDDGAVEEKRLFAHSVTSEMLWKGRTFRLERRDGAVAVYREVTGG